jgi:ABC-type Zn uptake system ZnuABC Zn-binding protein ZnuA
LLPLLCLTATLVACGKATPESRKLAPGEKLVVIASSFHLASLTASIAGDDARVEMLPAENAGPHGFEPTMADRRRIEASHLFVINGLGLEGFDAAKLARASGVTLVVASRTVPESFLISAEEGHEEHEGHDHGHGPSDPHVWLSLEGAAHQADAIAQSMADADPARAEGYKSRLAKLKGGLMALRDEYREKFTKLASRGFATDHDAFAYFAREFGLNQVAFLRKLPGQDVSLAERRALEERVRAAGARAMFLEPGHDMRAAKAFAEATGMKTATLDPLEIGRPAPGAYEKAMRANLEAAFAALAAAP